MRAYSLLGTALFLFSTASFAAPHVSVHSANEPVDDERNEVFRNNGDIVSPSSPLVNLRSRAECACPSPLPQSITYQEVTREELYAMDASIVRKHTDTYSKGKLGKRNLGSILPDANETVTLGLERRTDDPGPDPIVVYNDPVWPFITVGKVRFHSSTNIWECTGTLVGRRHVLTSPGCTKGASFGQFRPGFDNPGNTNGMRFGYSRIERVLTVKAPSIKPKVDCSDQNLYALVILRDTDATGDEVGYLGVRSPEKSHFQNTKRSLVTVSYPGRSLLGGERPFCMTGISAILETSFLCDATGPLMTDIGRWKADGPGPETISQGQRGMPIWEKEGGWVHGVLGYAFRSEKADYDQTVFAGGRGLLGMVAYAKERWP